MERKHYKARLLRTSHLSEKTKHFEFDVPEMERFDFVAGQFISMVAPKDGKPITRAYSIASGPRGDNTFDLCLNRVEGGFFSNFLCDLEDGAEVDFHGPHGLFVLRNPLRDCIFISTGTGVAPMRAFTDWLFDPKQPRHQGRRVWLVYGTRYDLDRYYQEEFEELARKYPNFRFEITISRPGPEWKGRKGYVQDIVREILQDLPAEERSNVDSYICGMAEMVNANRAMLKDEFGWDKKQIVFERYD
jgi:ferredoxin-NADP reductase